MSAADLSLANGETAPSDAAPPQRVHDTQALDSFSYDDGIVRMFMIATIFWGFIATAVGLLVALLLVAPNLWTGLDPRIAEYLSFGRLRPLHTNAAIFAFAGNAIFAAIYYSTQRLCKCRMWSDCLSQCHFWGWQAIIVAAAVTLPLGITQSKEYAELEWPIDLAIAVVWAGFFGINFMMTLVKRRERHMYVALWFYIATLVTVTLLHVFNNLIVPIGLFAGVPEAVEEASRLGEPLTVSQQFWWKSYSVYAGVQDALMQWWYGHNAVAFFLTTPFLGLMYYFLPKAAERPVFSYKLSIIHFWSLVFIYIWAGPHHLHYTALPEWASTFGMLFSVMLWMPSWGGMINGLLTLRGAWHKVTSDPVLKFFVVGITFYGMATFEGPLLSVKSVNALSHYTDWTIAHVHAGALGWNGFMTFGMIYWLLPRLFQTKLWSKSMAEWHFWLGTLGILLYIIPIYMAGITQGLMWRAMDDLGRLEYPDFVESVTASVPFWWARIVGGAMFVFGIAMLGVNAFMTWRNRPAKYDVPVHFAPRLTSKYADRPIPSAKLDGMPVLDSAVTVEKFAAMDWHRRWERLPIRFTVLTTLAVIIASLFSNIPMFLIRSNVPTIPSVKPYTPLELAGRDVYVSEGCYNCHSQMIRPMVAETQRYGDFSKAGEFIYDRPFQWGSRRIGPDLAREGGKQSSFWHWGHFEDPSQVTGSVMPSYKHLLSQQLNYKEIPARVQAAAYLNAPYDEELTNSIEMAQKQAEQIAAEIIAQGGPVMYEGKLIKDSTAIALIAYIQRLGTDLFKTETAPAAPADDAANVTASDEE